MAPASNNLFSTNTKIDLILSSGFLAFSRQTGMLNAVEDMGLDIGRLVGTSSGSLAASMWAAGLTSLQISEELGRKRPIEFVKPTRNINRGAFSLAPMTAHLRTVLPKDFNQLLIPLAVGVYDVTTGVFELITDGDLPQAVSASCAIPYIFQPISVGEPPRLMADGGIKDRTGISLWAKWIESESSKSTASTQSSDTMSSIPKALVHLVGTSISNKNKLNTLNDRNNVISPPNTSVYVVKTPKARAGFFSLRDYDTQRMEAYGYAVKQMLQPEFKSFLES
eukprot:gene8831-18286_t